MLGYRYLLCVFHLLGGVREVAFGEAGEEYGRHLRHGCSRCDDTNRRYAEEEGITWMAMGGILLDSADGPHPVAR